MLVLIWDFKNWFKEGMLKFGHTHMSILPPMDGVKIELSLQINKL